MNEDKIKTIIESLKGINQNEWFKLKHTIDQYFDIEASKQVNGILITSSNEIIELYKKLF